jgi:diadenylate cyclase
MRKNVRMMLLMKGVSVILILKLFSWVLQLTTLEFIVDSVMSYGVLAIIIIFQPEIRSALEQLGRNQFFGRHKALTINERDRVIFELENTVTYLSRRKIGALISLERDVSMSDYISKATPIYADLSASLLQTIFNPNTPLHDGAVIIQGDKVSCAGAFYPTTSNPEVDSKLGTRHRAGLGISEATDSVTIIVSEETGNISLVRDGEMDYDISLKDFEKKLRELITVVETSPEEGDHPYGK